MPHNPQSNAMIEHVNLMLCNMLQTFELEKQYLNEEDPLGEFLWALHSTYHLVIDATPGQLVYGMEILLPIQCKNYCNAITLCRREQMQGDNIKEKKN
jgi:hypothetical protein